MFERLFEPFSIGGLPIKNSIAMAPMATHFASNDGFVTDRLKEYYVARAKGGVGLIITESCYIHPEGRGGPNRLSICKNDTIAGLSELTSAIHAQGAKVAVQLHHGGRQISPDAICQYPSSASTMLCTGWGVRAIPRTLSATEIEQLVDAFGKAAWRAKSAGFDAVQILAAHGYLLWSFLSPLGNRRSDRYGGNLENRMRFLLEVIRCSRDEIGETPIMVRINGSDYLKGGITLKQSIATAQALQKAGVDAINVSAGTRESHEYQVPPRAFPEGCNSHLSAAIKKAVNIPVSIAGRIRSPNTAFNILHDKKADFIELGRALLCDPEWPQKVANGRQDDILPCISCIRCDERLFSNLDVACTVNPAAGKEKESEIMPTHKPKKVLVAGGGPAGLETALVAASRGHNVILYEKDNSVGGDLRVAAVGKHNTEFQEVIDYLERQMNKLGVDLRLGEAVNSRTIETVKPDVVVVATGSTPIMPKIPGIELGNVFTAHDVLMGKSEVGERVIVWGSGIVAFDVADYLSERKKEVTLLTRRTVRMGQENSNNKLLLTRICERGVKILINTHVEKMTHDSLIVRRAGKEEVLELDSLVVSFGAQPKNELATNLQGKTKELYAIGDCVKPREAFDAIHEGFRIALMI